MLLGVLCRAGHLRAGCAGWPLCALLCLRLWSEIREIPPGNHQLLLRSHARDQQKNNKRREKGQLRHATLPSWRGGALLFPCRFPPLVPSASCVVRVDACLTQGPTSPSSAPPR